MAPNERRLQFRNIVNLPMILQDEIAECGHACVAMISNFWGHRLDMHTIRSLHKPSTRGVTLRDINQIFEGLGFKTRALRVPINELHRIKGPAVLHWNMNHFVVLKQVKKKGVIIHDPAFGARLCGHDELSKSFTGVVLEIEKSQGFTQLTTQTKLSLFDLMKTAIGVKSLLALLVVLSLSIELLGLLNPLFMQYVTDQVIGSSDATNLYTLAAGFTIVLLAHAFTEFIRAHLVLYITTHLTEAFSSNVMKHLLALPLAFFEARHKGDIQSKFQGIDQIQKKISTDFINTLLDGFLFAVNLVVMLTYSRLLTSIVFFALLLYVGIRYVSYHLLKKQTVTSIHQHAKAASVFLETLHAIKPIKAFMKESMQWNTWRNGYIDALNADIQVSRIQIAYQTVNQLLFHLEHMIVICVGAKLVLTNQLSVGMLVAFLAYRMLLVTKFATFVQHVFDYKLISIQLNRLSDIVFQKPEVLSSGCGERATIKGALSLRNISFQYNRDTVFSNVTLDIKAGEKIAIVGPSGCGKSTLLKVMMGLLLPTSGEILIDGLALSDFGLKNYRDVIASVMQEDVLLSGSILDNIAFFEDQIDMAHLHHVAQLACIHATIQQFPMGYETLVGDMGSTLSGGQKQRILLARALYKQPKLLFLDEATSHLDVDNEKNINAALKSLDITQVIIAHRQETIQMADKVFDLTGHTL